MTISNKIRDEKLQCDINRVTAKMYALLSGKIDKYENLTGEEILLQNRKCPKQCINASQKKKKKKKRSMIFNASKSRAFSVTSKKIRRGIR